MALVTFFQSFSLSTRVRLSDTLQNKRSTDQCTGWVFLVLLKETQKNVPGTGSGRGSSACEEARVVTSRRECPATQRHVVSWKQGANLNVWPMVLFCMLLNT